MPLAILLMLLFGLLWEAVRLGKRPAHRPLKLCRFCNGTGQVPGDGVDWPSTCSTCNGVGVV